MTPYHQIVREFVDLSARAARLPPGGFDFPEHPALPPDAPKALIFAPHPDDECIVGGLALRLMRESGFRVVNVAVTLGSKRERRDERWAELENACRFIGFELVGTGPQGLENIRPDHRANSHHDWQKSVEVIADILREHSPRVIMFPHEVDWNQTHLGVHALVRDALESTPGEFTCRVVETEFWGAMDRPNLMVENTVDEVADLVAALSFHVGEVKRNPYHVSLPAWMQDNVRRGAELVLGQGGKAPRMNFATLYRLREWRNRAMTDVLTEGRVIPAGERAADVIVSG